MNKRLPPVKRKLIGKYRERWISNTFAGDANIDLRYRNRFSGVDLVPGRPAGFILIQRGGDAWTVIAVRLQRCPDFVLRAIMKTSDLRWREIGALTLLMD